MLKYWLVEQDKTCSCQSHNYKFQAFFKNLHISSEDCIFLFKYIKLIVIKLTWGGEKIFIYLRFYPALLASI